MKGKYTLKDLACDVLKSEGVPLTSDEIWERAVEKGLDKKGNFNGKTPWKSINAQIYVDISKKSESRFYQYSKRPAKFFLKDINITEPEKRKTSDTAETRTHVEKSYCERDLHALLTYFVFSDPHFRCRTMTIYHEKSKKESSGKNKWLHPDIVGVHFPFEEYDENTLKLVDTLGDSVISLFSFEMKKEIDISNLREYYFQAVSNSSWANEGYLVALKYAEDSSLLDEMRRLNNFFGIGFIKLNSENVDQSEIVLSAKYNSAIDWETVNRLIEENLDFREFVDGIIEDKQVKKIKSKYDEVYSPEKMEEYIQNKKIK